MDLFKQGMKGPTRQAPPVPFSVNRYSPVTNWNDDPFGADVFEPTPQFAQKKLPPPRPPPPKINKQPDVPVKPSHFMRKPTVLTSLLTRKSKTTVTNPSSHTNVNHSNPLMDGNGGNNELDTSKMFPRCEPKNVQMGALIDLSSPPSSPTFTTRSSSDGVSVDSFSSDATTSTNHHNAFNNGNASQAESGFEDDFDLFLNSRKKISKEDTLDDFTTIDPFSPPPVSNKPPLLKKPTLSKDLFDIPSNTSASALPLRGPTIIRAKPARPKPPDNSALLKSTFENLPIASMNINTIAPIQKIHNGFGDSFDSKPYSWEASPERESSPPMPSEPPPPPPALDAWPDEPDADFGQDEEPYAIALFDYFTDHPDDLCFSTNSRITLIRRVDDEWLFGSVRSGAQGLFPASYVQVKRAPRGAGEAGAREAGEAGAREAGEAGARAATATALYDFRPQQPGDLPLCAGARVTVLSKLSEEWYLGECLGLRGQFPFNYVQIDS